MYCWQHNIVTQAALAKGRVGQLYSLVSVIKTFVFMENFAVAEINK
jgi:hypothetical protein